MSDTEVQLEFATTQQLIEEFQRRSQASIVIFVPKCDEHRVSYRYDGARMTILGMLMTAQTTLMAEITREQFPPGEDK